MVHGKFTMRSKPIPATVSSPQSATTIYGFKSDDDSPEDCDEDHPDPCVCWGFRDATKA